MAAVFLQSSCKGRGQQAARPQTSTTAASSAPTRIDQPPGKEHLPVPPGMEFVKIPEGMFHNGCEPQDPQCAENEKPGVNEFVHAFRLTRTEVTVEQYAACVTAGECKQPREGGAGGSCNWDATGREKHPINCIDQQEAMTFCGWATARLPSAQEWEYAAKSRDHRVYPWGNAEPDPSRARYGVTDGTSVVGSHPAGATLEGLQDMAGNVWEWTSSKYDATLTEVRGGSWRNGESRLLRASNRGRRPASERADFIGFRCAQ
jgi:formylglycine-generating enzyme required for sulfatase activity